MLQHGCNVYGTQQRQKTKKLFPYTFDHEDVPHNIPKSGTPVSLYSRNGQEVALGARCWQGKVVLLRATTPKWAVPERIGISECRTLSVATESLVEVYDDRL